MLDGVLSLICEFMAQAIIIASVLGIMTRLGNVFVRAVSGKEDIL